MTRQRCGASDAGFTLIEVMVSMVILSFVVAELAMVSVSASRTSAYAQRLTRANQIAETLLEKCRNRSFVKTDIPFSTANAPADPVQLDLAGDGVLQDYSETCAPAGALTVGAVRTCSLDAGIFHSERTVTFWRFNAAVPPSAIAAIATESMWADVTVSVSWSDMRGQTNQVQVASRISAR